MFSYVKDGTENPPMEGGQRWLFWKIGKDLPGWYWHPIFRWADQLFYRGKKIRIGGRNYDEENKLRATYGLGQIVGKPGVLDALVESKHNSVELLQRRVMCEKFSFSYL
jgi:hypothetical protein